MSLRLRINGREREIRSDPETPLLYVLRDELKLKGTRFGCGLEQCGACAVLADGAVALSCATPARDFAGRDITTVEGLENTPIGRRVQAAFVEATAAQCGWCTSGLAVAATALLSRTPRPRGDEARYALAPHLCRCGSHPRVLRAVEIASAGA